MPQTIAQILEGMKTIIENNEVRSPGWWLDEAMKLAVLRQDLQSELTIAEIKFRNEVVELTHQNIPYNKAENMIKGRDKIGDEKMTSYQWFNYLKTRDRVVEEIIRVAKKRASLVEPNF